MSATVKDRFREAWAEAERAHRAGRHSIEVAAELAERSDEILRDVFRSATGERSSDAGGVALVALGGYGRKELAPGSDLDVLLLHRGLASEQVAEVNQRVMYPLWDAGLDVGNRTRSIGEALSSLGDVEEATALIEVRCVAGDSSLVNELEMGVSHALRRRRHAVFRDLRNATLERHQKHGHAGHLLEPDIRESAGGLRDIQTLRWLSAVLPGGPGPAALVEAGALGQTDEQFLEAAYALLWRVRIESHLVSGRREDRLHLENQDEIARRLGYVGGSQDRFPGDLAMQELYRVARGVHAVVEGIWDELPRRRGRRMWRPAVRTLGDGCVIRDGHLEVLAVTAPEEDPAGWLRVFRHALREGTPIRRASLRRLEAALPPGTTVSWTPEARDIFCEILRWGPAAVDVLETIDRCGLLPALIGPWKQISCLPQRDLFHRYTVDMHLFNVVAELAASRSSDDPAVDDAWSHVDDDTSLFLGALVHDIAKGRPGDHTRVGGELAREITEQMGFTPEQVDDVSFLVRDHLTLASLATHRDTADERTIEEVAKRAETPRRLAMLFLLTRADSLATAPEAWSVFRAALIRELYGRALRYIEEGAVAPLSPESRPDVPVLDPGESVRVLVRHDEHGDELVVVAHDRPGLFATACGVLALRGIDVHAAEIGTRGDGVAVDVFRVRGLHGQIPEDRWDRIRDDVAGALEGRFDVDEALRRKARHIRRRALPGRPAQIVVDNEASARSTVVEVRTADRLGVLRVIAKALADAGCDIRLAKVATYGAEVVDVFYVTDSEGHRIEEPTELDFLRSSLKEALRRAE